MSVGININQIMKVIARVLIRFDNNIDSKRIPEGNLRNLTHRLEADSKKWP